MLRFAVQSMLADSDLWVQRGRYTTIRFHSSRMVLPHRYPRLQACGFVAVLHMVTMRAGPDPISPFLLRAAIETRSRACAADVAFLQLLDPEAYQSVIPWVARSRTAPLVVASSSPIGNLLYGANIDVCPLVFLTSLAVG